MGYTPSQQLLENYADVLINFALGSGAGIKPGETVRVTAQEAAKPLYIALCRAVWQAGGNVIENYLPDETDMFGGLNAIYHEATSDEQFDFFPRHFTKGLIDDCDHMVVALSDTDPHALEGVDPGKIMRRGQARKPMMDWRNAKESAGKFTWTVGLYGTAAMAHEAGMSEEEYWQQITSACFLDDADPKARWREAEAQIRETMGRLNALPIERLHVEGADADLWITLGEQRRWLGGSGRNIPSFEIFTSPDRRGTEGWIRFNQPLYRYGNLIEGVRLEFKAGKVVDASATKNQPVLREMIATPGADQIGEFSLTDSRLSRITRFMAETLYDENIGGRYGNTHLALGMSYQDTYDGDPGKVSQQEWERLGYNDSAVHTDIISTIDRTVTAVLRDGREQVIYRDGKFEV